MVFIEKGAGGILNLFYSLRFLLSQGLQKRKVVYLKTGECQNQRSRTLVSVRKIAALPFLLWLSPNLY